MNVVETAALAILTAFYASFFLKMLRMKRQGLDSNLLGKGEKAESARRVELRLKAVTAGGAVVQLASVFLSGLIPGLTLPGALSGLGLLLAAGGTALFIAAMAAMKNNWRSGHTRNQNTGLVVGGPYEFSRNPAFVGFDLLYIGLALALPNMVNLMAAALAAMIFHRQILEEERFLQAAFGDDYRQYQARVHRYLGRRAS